MNPSNIQKYSTNNRKVFDSIYGFIVFPKQIWEFIDTPHFQRLRNIKQLGCLSWVFPGALNSRFQHCLGTGYLAQKYIITLIQRHNNKTINPKVYEDYYEKKETKKQQQFKSTIQQAIFTVTLAGVLHDIGHGPYSHLFDSKVVDQIDNKKWEHEIASLCLIDEVYKYVLASKQNPKQIEWLKNTKNRVKALIIGKISEAHYKPLQDGQYIYEGEKEVDNLQEGFLQIFKDELKIRPWEFEIVSNRLTGIDVDKLDYFRRDAYYLGAKNIYIDHQLLMSETLVLQQRHHQDIQVGEKQKSEIHRLCYPSKYSDKVYDIYYSRYKLYKTYYMSLKANGVDFMIAQILQEAQPYLKLKEACRQLLKGNCEKYIRLTDSILQKIEDAYDIAKQKQQNKQTLSQQFKGILRAGKILHKLKKRQIYDFVKEYHKSFSFQKICSYYKIKNLLKKMIKQQKNINSNVIIHCSEIGFGIKDKDPFQQCRFYDKSQQVKQIEQSNERNFSMLRPQGIIEISLRVYLKNRVKNPTQADKNKIEAMQKKLFKKLQKIDSDFISGQSGTYTNRSQSVPVNHQTGLNNQHVHIQQNKEINSLNHMLEGQE